jgi:hypothetical protein
MLETFLALIHLISENLLIRTFFLIFIGFGIMHSVISSWELYETGVGLQQKAVGLSIFILALAVMIFLTVLVWR